MKPSLKSVSLAQSFRFRLGWSINCGVVALLVSTILLAQTPPELTKANDFGVATAILSVPHNALFYSAFSSKTHTISSVLGKKSYSGGTKG